MTPGQSAPTVPDSVNRSATPKPRRRWFRPRYSLTTLFVVVTVIEICAGWVTTQMRWIRDRRAFFENQNFPTAAEQKEPPGILGLFGETGRVWVDVIVDSSDLDQLTSPEKERVEEARRLFPESKVRITHVDPNNPQHFWSRWSG